MVRSPVNLASAWPAFGLVVQEMWRQCGRGRRRGRRQIVRRHGNWTLVSRAAEAVDRFFVTARNGRRTALLQANDIASEAEAEVAGVVSRYLLRGHVHFVAVATSSRSENIGIVVVVFVPAVRQERSTIDWEVGMIRYLVVRV